MFNREEFYMISLKSSAETKIAILNQCKTQVFKAIDIMLEAVKNNYKILFIGNGGSAADCQHLAAEFVIRLSHDLIRPSIPAIALTTDSSILTAGGNDIGFVNVFARQIEGIGSKNDVLIALSTSGNSLNIINAVNTAKQKGLTVITFLGGNGGKLKGIADCEIIIPSENVQRIQEGHITIGHIVCESVERELYG